MSRTLVAEKVTGLVAEKVTGHRTLAGTDFPVVVQVVREQLPGKRPTWIVTRGLCNGVPSGAEEFVTRRAAMTDFEASS